MDVLLEILHKFFFIGLIFTFYSDAIVLSLRGKNNKVRQVMSFILFVWASAYLFVFISLLAGTPRDMNSLFRVNVLITGHYFITFMFLFPMQVLLPGWLNLKKFFLMFLPIIILTGIYYVGTKLTGQAPEDIKSYAMLISSIGHFNVWFRFVFLLANFVYIAIMLKWLYGYEKKYVEWKNENFSDQDYVDISWMRSYDILMVLIFLCYIGVLVFGGRLTVILHTIVVIVGFNYLFFKALFYENPYPEDFFKKTSANKTQEPVEAVFVLSDDPRIEEVTEQSFESRMESYTKLLTKWMADEKPYLYKDFKLSDVARVLPLNRSYLSRVFNEGFGKNFNEVVRFYRVEYSREVLSKEPSFPLHKVAELCGFGSDSTFIRAFKQVTGMTPSQFKAKTHENQEGKS